MYNAEMRLKRVDKLIENRSTKMDQKTKIIMILMMLCGGFFGLLNETLLTTALPSIMKDFKIDYTQVQWLTTAFLLTNGVIIPLSAMIIQRYST